MAVLQGREAVAVISLRVVVVSDAGLPRNVDEVRRFFCGAETRLPSFGGNGPGGQPLAAVDTEAEVLSALVQSKRNRRDRLKLVLFPDRNLRERDRVDLR